MRRRRSSAAFTAPFVLFLLLSGAATAQAPALSKEQKIEFLVNARIVESREIGKGVTHPWRLTLTDGAIKHHAKFQSVNEKKPAIQFAMGGGEINFVDSYLYNLAAYRLAELLDIDYMMPVTVQRRWKGTIGSLEWWIDDVQFEEGETGKQGMRV